MTRLGTLTMVGLTLGLLAGPIGSALYRHRKANLEEQAKQVIVSNPDVTAQQFASLEKRVEAEKTTYVAFSDSLQSSNKIKASKLNKANEIKVDTLKEEISHLPGQTAKKFSSYEARAQKDLQKWTQISDSLKAQQLFKLSKKFAK